MKNILIKVIPAVLIMLSGNAYSQGVAINTDGALPNSNSILDVVSSNKGILIPRIDYNNRPTTGLTSGLLIYVTTNGPSGNNTFYYYNGSDWTILGGGGSSEWTDEGTVLHPADLSGAEDVAIGGTTSGGADIYLGATGAAVFNEQSNDADFRIEGDNDANVFFVDASLDDIGIGTNTPTAKLHIYETGTGKGNVLFQGDYGDGGDPPVTGAGARMMWYPDKAAFRTGYVDGTQWDKASIGNYSFASNYNTVASGTCSFASGNGTTASGSYSFASGEGTTASGDYSAAMGYYTTAQAYASLAIGRYNVVSGTTNSWVATDPVFVVGIGTGTGASSANALTVLKNGNVGIGTTAPAALFSVGSTSQFQINSSGNVLGIDGTAALPSYSFHTGGDEGIYSGGADILCFSGAGTVKMTILAVGNVGIASATPCALLDVTGGSAALRITNTGTARQFRFYEPSGSGSNYTALVSGNVTPAYDLTLTLPTAYAAVNGYVLASSIAGALSWKADATSDMRLKKNIKPLENSLERVLKLNGCSFQYIDTTKYESGIQMGFIAQEAAGIVPEIVRIDPVTGYYYMHNQNLTALLAEAIKEQQKLIEDPQYQINELKYENKKIKADNQKINQRLDNIESILKTTDK